MFQKKGRGQERKESLGFMSLHADRTTSRRSAKVDQPSSSCCTSPSQGKSSSVREEQATSVPLRPPEQTGKQQFYPKKWRTPQILSQDKSSWSGLMMYRSLISPAPCTGIYSPSPSLPRSLGKDSGGKTAVSAPSEDFTHHWGISEAFDSLENAPSYGPHGEGPSAVIHYPPGTGKKNRDENIKSHHVKPCKWLRWIQRFSTGITGVKSEPGGYTVSCPAHWAGSNRKYKNITAKQTQPLPESPGPLPWSGKYQIHRNAWTPHTRQRHTSIMENSCRIPALPYLHSVNSF